MKVYLAGKITGDPNYREKFAAAAKKLEERAGCNGDFSGGHAGGAEKGGLYAHLLCHAGERRHGGVLAGLGGQPRRTA